VIDLAQAKASRKKAKKTPATATHIILAQAVMAVIRQRGEDLMFTDTAAWRYTDQLWVQQGDKDLAAWLNSQLEDGARGLKMESASRLINEARAYIIRDPYLQARKVLFDTHGKVPTLSGLVDPASGSLTPPDPEHYCTWRVPFEYDPAATCPHWLQLLGDAFADRPAAVRAEYTALLQEWLGMSLLDDRTKALSCILFFQGGSDYGKSEIINVLAGLFGPRRNTTPIDMLDKPHGLMAFARRVPWVLPEAFDQGKWHLSSATKALASGEPVQINMKNGAIFDHTFTGPIIWGANTDPQFKEATAAITNRLLIVPCRRKFDPETPVGVAIAARAAGLYKPSQLVLRDEMPGVLAWAVQGLLRAVARGYFKRPEASRIAAENVQRDTNIVMGFVADCVAFDPDSMVSVPDFAAGFASWWAEGKGSETRIPGSESVSKALKALAEPRIAFDLRDNSRRYYAGIRLNDEGRRYWSNAVTSDAFVFQSRKASTTESGGNPNRALVPGWEGKEVIIAMRAAHAKSVTVGSDTFPPDRDRDNPSRDPSRDLSSTQPADPIEDIPF
jgi:phage/plasmid-associated DNA primase